MDIFENPATKGAAVALGVGLHLGVFRLGEWDLETTKIILTFGAFYAAATVAAVRLVPGLDATPLVAASEVGRLVGYVIVGLTLSILTYRALFHRLNRFPGPFAARLSNLYPTYLSAKKLHLYEEVQKLHGQYGDFVRLGPSELSIAAPEAAAIIHGPQSACVKGPWYTVLHPTVPLNMCRNKEEHGQRRKIWDRGFGAKALRDYEPRIARYTDQLLEAVKSSDGKPINMTDWFNFFTFDAMGDLSFGKSFGMLAGGIKHYFMTSLHASMTNVAIFSHMVWFFPIFKGTPILNAEYKGFWKFVNSQVDERKQMTPDRPDVFSWLLEDFKSKRNPSKQDRLNLCGDAYLIVVAGSDTTAAALTCLFFELTQHESCVKALQKEIDEYYAANQGFENPSLSKLAYLDAVINESLRLHPPVPSGVQRVTPAEGLQIGETYVPGNTIVQIPIHTVMRDERSFEDPNSFIPERWTTNRHMVINQKNFIPFSVGKYSCIGKQLGLMEIRHVTAQLLHKYDVSLAPDQSPQKFLEGKRDTFTLALGPLQLKFTPRTF